MYISNIILLIVGFGFILREVASAILECSLLGMIMTLFEGEKPKPFPYGYVGLALVTFSIVFEWLGIGLF